MEEGHEQLKEPKNKKQKKKREEEEKEKNNPDIVRGLKLRIQPHSGESDGSLETCGC